MRASPSRYDSFAPWIVAGAGWLVAGSGLALLAATRDDTAWHHLLWPSMLYGFIAPWIFGAGRRLLPSAICGDMTPVIQAAPEPWQGSPQPASSEIPCGLASATPSCTAASYCS